MSSPLVFIQDKKTFGFNIIVYFFTHSDCCKQEWGADSGELHTTGRGDIKKKELIIVFIVQCVTGSGSGEHVLRVLVADQALTTVASLIERLVAVVSDSLAVLRGR